MVSGGIRIWLVRKADGEIGKRVCRKVNREIE